MLHIPFVGRMGKNSIFDQNPHVQIESIKETIHNSDNRVIIKMFINNYGARY